MKCSEAKFNLSLYSDEVLSADERGELDAHLDTCPLCRQALSEYQSVRNDLRLLARPTLSSDILANLRSTVAAQLQPVVYGPAFHLIDDRRSWFEAWMMPSAVGTLASVVAGFFLLWAILSTAPNPSEFVAAAKTSDSSIILTPGASRFGADMLDMSPSEYANTRLSVSGESPSINPQGALIALTRSLVRGKMEDEEVVVVADVFGNGLARITEVVEPTKDIRAIEQLERALDSDPAYAPFVPASYDKRSEITRVVFKIQNVNVSTSLKAPRRGRS